MTEDNQVDNNVYIEHCIQCSTHRWHTMHNEQKYHDFYQKLKEAIEKKYPKIKVIKNDVWDQLMYVHDELEPNVRKIMYKGQLKKFPQTGAFEIYYKTKKIYSKIVLGIWPSVKRILQKISDLDNNKAVIDYDNEQIIHEHSSQFKLEQSLYEDQSGSNMASRQSNRHPNIQNRQGLQSKSRSPPQLMQNFFQQPKQSIPQKEQFKSVNMRTSDQFRQATTATAKITKQPPAQVQQTKMQSPLITQKNTIAKKQIQEKPQQTIQMQNKAEQLQSQPQHQQIPSNFIMEKHQSGSNFVSNIQAQEIPEQNQNQNTKQAQPNNHPAHHKNDQSSDRQQEQQQSNSNREQMQNQNQHQNQSDNYDPFEQADQQFMIAQKDNPFNEANQMKDLPINAHTQQRFMPAEVEISDHDIKSKQQEASKTKEQDDSNSYQHSNNQEQDQKQEYEHQQSALEEEKRNFKKQQKNQISQNSSQKQDSQHSEDTNKLIQQAERQDDSEEGQDQQKLQQNVQQNIQQQQQQQAPSDNSNNDGDKNYKDDPFEQVDNDFKQFQQRQEEELDEVYEQRKHKHADESLKQTAQSVSNDKQIAKNEQKNDKIHVSEQVSGENKSPEYEYDEDFDEDFLHDKTHKEVIHVQKETTSNFFKPSAQLLAQEEEEEESYNQKQRQDQIDEQNQRPETKTGSRGSQMSRQLQVVNANKQTKNLEDGEGGDEAQEEDQGHDGGSAGDAQADDQLQAYFEKMEFLENFIFENTKSCTIKIKANQDVKKKITLKATEEEKIQIKVYSSDPRYVVVRNPEINDYSPCDISIQLMFLACPGVTTQNYKVFVMKNEAPFYKVTLKISYISE